MREVLVVGDANVDIVVPYPVFLNEERTRVKYPEPEMHGGGTAANTAIALAKLDVPTSFIGTVGDDQYGRHARQVLRLNGIDVEDLFIDPTVNTVGVFAFVDEYGERYLWGWPRTEQSFKYLDRSRISMERVRQAGWVHSSGMTMTYPTSARETILAIFKEAHAAGVPTSFDLNSRCDDRDLDPEFKAVLLEIISYTTYLLGSGPDEFEYLGEGGWRENAAALVAGDRTVIARDGERGSSAFFAAGETSAPAFGVDVVDTIGAGDVYNAGFIAAILDGQSLDDALVQANAISGYSVAKKGPQNSPDPAELRDFLAHHLPTTNS